LAALQRKSEDNPDAKAGLGPKLLNVNKWVKAEAAQQRELLLAGHKKGGKDIPKGGDGDGGVGAGAGGGSGSSSNISGGDASSSLSMVAGETGGVGAGVPANANNSAVSKTRIGTSQVPVEMEPHALMVECLVCRILLPWNALEAGDGQCSACLQQTCLGELQESAASICASDQHMSQAQAAFDIHSAAGIAVSPKDEAKQVRESEAVPGSKSSWRSRRRLQRSAADV